MSNLNPLDKTLRILALVIFFGSSLKAQETMHTNAWVAGGSFSFSVQQNGSPLVLNSFNGSISYSYASVAVDSRNTNFRFSPYIGREVSAHWMMGVQMHYGMRRYHADDVSYNPVFGQTDTVDIQHKENEFGVGLFGRYLINPTNQFVFYAQPAFNYFTSDDTSFIDGTEDDRFEINSFEVGVSAGALYNLSEHFRLTARMGVLGFTSGHWENPATGEENNFSAFSTSVNLANLFFGFEARF